MNAGGGGGAGGTGSDPQVLMPKCFHRLPSRCLEKDTQTYSKIKLYLSLSNGHVYHFSPISQTIIIP